MGLIQKINKSNLRLTRLILNLDRCKKDSDRVKLSAMVVCETILTACLVSEAVKSIETLIELITPQIQKNDERGEPTKA